MTGGPIEHLQAGWAVFPFQGKVAHFWREDTATMMPQIRDGGRVRFYVADCGYIGAVDARAPALEPGTFAKCKNCLRQRARRAA